jgi:hypothetical protein
LDVTLRFGSFQAHVIIADSLPPARVRKRGFSTCNPRRYRSCGHPAPSAFLHGFRALIVWFSSPTVTSSAPFLRPAPRSPPPGVGRPLAVGFL